MSRKDHQLIILMLAKQQQAFQVLIDVLREQGRMTPDVVEEIAMARLRDLGLANDSLSQIKSEYWQTAEKIGLVVPSGEEPDQTEDRQE